MSVKLWWRRIDNFKCFSPEDLDVLELLHGVPSDELRKEPLKEKNPKINKLFQVARNWIHGVENDKNFKPAAISWVARASSDYKKDQAQEQQQKAQDLAAQKDGQAKDETKSLVFLAESSRAKTSRGHSLPTLQRSTSKLQLLYSKKMYFAFRYIF